LKKNPQRGCYSSLAIMLRNSASYLHFSRRISSKKQRDLSFARVQKRIYVILSMRRYCAGNQPLHAQPRSAFSNYHQQNHLILFPVSLPNNPDPPLIDRPWRVASYLPLRRKQANSVESSSQTDKKLKFQLFPWHVSPPPEQRLCQLP
jgi:hypothetical protein